MRIGLRSEEGRNQLLAWNGMGVRKEGMRIKGGVWWVGAGEDVMR